MRCPHVLMIIVASLTLAGCSSQGLRDLRNQGDGPDEFMIIPVKPLTVPDNVELLPAPTPGGANLVDPNPRADAVAALGGNPAALTPTAGVPSSDVALVQHSSRYGVPSNIRETTNQADAEFRDRQSRMTRVRLFPVDRYSQAYQREAIDPFIENERFRRSGFGTPSAPPRYE